MRPEAARLFKEAEIRGERVVAVLRVVVALALGTVFLLQAVPRDADIDAVFTPQSAIVLLQLIAYLGVGLVSFRVAGSAAYRGWMSWGFASLDLAFIGGYVWFGLGRAGLGAPYIPALPVIWLAPLVLAFGALRYNPYLQGYVTLGLLAAVALAAMPLDAALAPAEATAPEALGRLFAAPPNVMRLAMLLLAGLVLIVAAARARALLARETEETRRRGNLTRYLPPQIADWLSVASIEEMRGGRRQPVAVLFADIRDFTHRAEALDPGELTRFVGGFRHCVTVAAGRHGGVIDKFIGDSALVLFGVPEPGEHDARNALACARAILDEVVAWNGRLAAAGQAPAEVGIGAHWGEVFCGAVGDDARLEFTVLGDAVNVAARLQEETKAAGRSLLVSRELLEAAGLSPEDEAWTALPEQRLRGREAPVRMFAAT